MKSFSKLLVFAVITTLAGCGEGEDDPLARICGLSCPGSDRLIDGVKIGGVAEGNASITGVPKVDAFFAATINFQSAANDVSNGIQAQLDLIKADFGIEGDDVAGGLKKQFDDYLQAGIKYDYQPAKCAIDAQATLEASAKCDAEVSGGTATVECKGSCAVEAKAGVKCDVDADLYCTVTAPEVHCDGDCSGSCIAAIDGKAGCNGVCRGSCNKEDGSPATCSAYSDAAATQCAGTCDGNCMGSCEAKLTAAASCDGMCRGECTAKAPEAGCAGSVRAECKAKAKATFECQGKCTGDFEPPKVKADCSATAKAQASVNVQCSPPSLKVTYGFKTEATDKFKGALTTLLDVRMPALLQATGRGSIVGTAGDGLKVAASGAVKSAVDTLKGQTTLKVRWTLVNCAGGQLDDAAMVISKATDTLTDKMNDAKGISAAVGLNTI